MYAKEVIRSMEFILSLHSNGSDRLAKYFINHTVNSIKGAQRFHLGDYSDYYDLLGKKMGDKKVFCSPELLQNIRLPYKKTWFDFTSTGNDSPVHVYSHGEEDVKVPVRGILAEEVSEDCFVAWTFNKVDTQDKDLQFLKKKDLNWIMCPFFSLISTKDGGITLEEASIIIKSTYPEAGSLLKEVTPNMFLFATTDNIKQMAISMGVSEDMYLRQMFLDEIRDYSCLNLALMLLNAKNIGAQDHTHREIVKTTTKKGKSKKRKIKIPALTYKTLVLKPFGKKQKKLQDQGLWDNKLHLCRGHFKVYTAEKPLFGKYVGVFWWQPQIRGSEDRGTIVKDYRLDVAA